MIKKIFLSSLTLLLSSHLFAAETDWLDLKKGSSDKVTGATIRDVVTTDGQGNTTVTVAVPKNSVDNSKKNEEVVVYAKKINKKEAVVDNVTYEWLNDYEHDNYGLVIKLGKNTQLPIRLYFKGTETDRINP